jgi:hypothetical protein
MEEMRAFVVISLLALALVSAAAASTGHGRVRVLTSAPLLVRGTGFKAHEQVVVTVRSGAVTRVARVTSSATGAFTAQFVRGLPAQHCGSSIAVRAVGSLGDTVAWKSPQQECGTQLGP